MTPVWKVAGIVLPKYEGTVSTPLSTPGYPATTLAHPTIGLRPMWSTESTTVQVRSRRMRRVSRYAKACICFSAKLCPDVANSASQALAQERPQGSALCIADGRYHFLEIDTSSQPKHKT